MNFSRIVGVALLILLLAPQAAVAATTTTTTTASTTTPKTVGLSAGDTAVYSYDILTTYELVNGQNITESNLMNQFTLGIIALNTTLGVVEYSDTVNVFNSTTLTSGVYATTGTTETIAPAVNITTIFNPYNNDTYLGNIGFDPFTYTDIWNGTVKNLHLSAHASGLGYTSIIVAPQLVSASVLRTPESIDITFNQVAYEQPKNATFHTAMVFSPTTGMLLTGVTRGVLYGYTKVFTYRLLSFSTPPASYSYLLWDALLAIMAAIVVAVAAHEVSARGTRHERKAARMKKKLK